MDRKKKQSAAVRAPAAQPDVNAIAGKAALVAWRQDIAAKKEMLGKQIVTASPKGERYEAMVPDTLDLANRGWYALNMLLGMVDPQQDYELFLWCNFNAHPAYMTYQWGYLGGHFDVPKVVEALPEMRLMSGDARDPDIERGIMLDIMAMSWDDGILYSPPAGARAWHASHPKYAGEISNTTTMPRLLLAMLYWYEYDGNPLWLEHARKMYRTFRDIIVQEDGPECAYVPPGWYYHPKSGFPGGKPPALNLDFPDNRARFSQACGLGYFIRGIARYAAVTGDKDALDLARRLANTLRKPQFWVPDGHARGVVPAHRAQYSGHVHVWLCGPLRGLLEYAQVANDAELKQFVRQGYEYTLTHGMTEIGWVPCNTGEHFAENCAIADLNMLAVKLSEYGVGDYWDDVDRFARNQIVENQLIDRAQIERISAAGWQHKKVDAPMECDDRAIERSLGTFGGYTFFTEVPTAFNFCCCNHNGAQALYHVWNAIVQDKGNGVAQINLLLNRASKLLDVDSYLPYEGKVVVHNKTARKVYLRVPAWVSKPAIRCHVDGKTVHSEWMNNYLVFEQVRQGGVITVEFPMVDRTIKRILAESGIEFTIRLRGNTVLDISPRVEELPGGLVGGELVISRGTPRFTVKGLQEKDLTVDVDVESNSPCGILLRYKDEWNFVVAQFQPRGKSISIEECVDGQQYVYRDAVSVGALLDDPNSGSHSRLGEVADVLPRETKLHITARINGSDAQMVVGAGGKSFTARCRIDRVMDAGTVGLVQIIRGPASRVGVVRQRCKNFRVTGPDGAVIFQDDFSVGGPAEGAPVPPPGWEMADPPVTYRIYLRDHMKGDKVPMVKRTRFAPAGSITP